MQPGLRKVLSGLAVVLFFLVIAVPCHAQEAKEAAAASTTVLKEADFSLDDEDEKGLTVKAEDKDKDDYEDDAAKMNNETTVILDE